MKNNSAFYRFMNILALLILCGCSRQYATTVATKSTVADTPAKVIPTATASLPPGKTYAPVDNSELTSEPDCLTMGGQVLAKSIPSMQMGGEIKFHIYLPPCYDKNTTHRYPVLYLIHGQNFDDNQWIRLGVPQAADKLISEGIPPFIIVLPFDKYSYRQPSADPFDDAMINELLPYIDTHYRTIAKRTSRAMGGLSRGGGWALHFALNHPGLFGAFGGHSLAIFDEDGSRLSRMLDAVPADELPRIYMDIGKSDGLRASTGKFELMLTQRGIPHEWYINPGYHDEAYWSKHIEEYLKWYASGWSGE